MSDTSTSTEPGDSATPTPPDATTDDALADPGRKALDVERKARRDAEKDAKTLRAQLAAIKTEQLDETGKAVEAAKVEGRNAAVIEMGSKLVAAEFKAAAAGRPIDVDALLDGVDRAKFLTDDGDADTDAITAWVDRIAPAADLDPTPPGFSPMPDLGQGSRQTIPLGSDPLLALLESVVGKTK